MRVRFNQTCNDFDKGEEVECTRDELRRFRPECYTVIQGDRGGIPEPPDQGSPPAEKTTTAARAGRTTAVK